MPTNLGFQIEPSDDVDLLSPGFQSILGEIYAQNESASEYFTTGGFPPAILFGNRVAVVVPDETADAIDGIGVDAIMPTEDVVLIDGIGVAVFCAGLPPPPIVVVVIPDTVARDGGYLITLTGLPHDGRFLIHVGLNGDATDPLLVGTTPGDRLAHTVVGGSVTALVRPLDPGGPYRFFLEKISGSGPSTFLTEPLLIVSNLIFRGKLLSLRSNFPPHYAVGYRRSGQVDPQ